MTTPLLILSILIIPYILVYGLEKYTGAAALAPYRGVLGLSLAFAFFGMGHFVKTDEMMLMLPAFVPFKEFLVYLTGIIEFALAITLLIPKTGRVAGIACILVLIFFFPANIYAALNYTGMGGHTWGPVYLLIRVPLQLILIFWAYWFVVRKNSS